MTITAPIQAPAIIDTVIDAVEHPADGVASLILRRADGSDFPQWAPGSHIDLYLTDELTRQYSLCSPTDDLSTLRVGVLRTPDSRGGSAWVHDQLRAGGELRISAPRNNFPLVDSRKYLFLAGGIGITPIIPMLRAAEAQGKEWTLYYGGRSRDTMAFAQQLEDEFGAQKVRIIAEDESGRLDLQQVLGMPRAHMLVYACGPGGMLGAVEDFCMGWPPGALHTERFAADTLGVGGNTEPFEVQLALTGTTLRVETNQTILEAAEEVGVRVLSSCRAGLCGTCETRIISGEAEHRDAALSQADKDAGDVMMVCVSRAAAGCSKLVLEL